MIQFRNILLLTLLLSIAASAKGQQDSRADKFLQAVSEQFDLNTAYKIKLDYIREDLMQETSAEGEGMIWMKGLKYKIIVDEYISYYNGEQLFSQNTDNEEVYVSVPDPDQPGYLQAVPIRIIKSYEQDFNYMYIGVTPLLGKELVEIQLYPRERSGPYSMLKMFIHPVSLKLEVIQLKHKEGILYTMSFSGISVDKSITDSTFVFDPAAFPNTEIIELVE